MGETLDLPPPDEIICDDSRALLAGFLRAYTKYSTNNEYADSFLKNRELPALYLRIDVLHFIKLHVNFLKSVRKDVAAFYKAGIGQLIMSNSFEAAEIIIRAPLTISQSRYDSRNEVGEISECATQKQIMDHIFTATDIDESNFEPRNENNHGNKISTEFDDDETNIQPSLMLTWAEKINISVNNIIKLTVGTRDNDFWLPDIADKLVCDLAWLPLWSCVVQEKFGYDRCPASSASAEIEFNSIKNRMLKEESIPIRVDSFVTINKNYQDGLVKIFDAALQGALKKANKKPSTNIHEFESSHHVYSSDTESVNKCETFKLPPAPPKSILKQGEKQKRPNLYLQQSYPSNNFGLKRWMRITQVTLW